MSSELAHLVKMANQIALNAGAGAAPDVAAERTAEHIGRYWAVPMRKRLVEHLDEVGDELNPAARGAMEKIRQALQSG